MSLAAVGTAISGAISGIGAELGAIASFGSEVLTKIKPVIDTISNVKGAVSSVKGVVSNVVSGAKKAVSNITSGIKGIFGGSSNKKTGLSKATGTTSSQTPVKQMVNSFYENLKTVRSFSNSIVKSAKTAKPVKSDWRPIYNGYTNELKGEQK